MNGTFDDVDAAQTDNRLNNDAPWSEAEQRVTEKLEEAAEIFDAAETIHEWGGLDDWTAVYTEEGSAITFEHPDGAWVRISEGSVDGGFDVHTSTGAERAVPQRAIVSTKRYVHSLDRCVTTAVARICAYSRDGAF
ncbi:hypothetical protein [Halorubrum lacusprofundi]|jgi:hypothetical protein|uniref:Uncharacterized protein n=1 Tax=Halorubrum lacusprofundi TaxID=2247 RepID=A0A220SWW8_9EURY|nr:hypothetical protein [Halorubrum lacusprofundi]ASK38177.1 hypothetical protein [Halorubrum lacusprofundi]